MTKTAARLILCAGPYAYGDEFKTLDANPEYRPDYCETLPPLPRHLRTGEWEEIYLIHGIEHFHPWEARELLTQIYEALAPDGTLILEQPDISIAARVMLGQMEPMTAEPEASGINAIFGDPRYENPLMSHKWGWTPETLTNLLVECGFSLDRIKSCRAMSRPFAEGRDFRIEAKK